MVERLVRSRRVTGPTGFARADLPIRSGPPGQPDAPLAEGSRPDGLDIENV
jgi:hypothetical protein